MDGENWCVAYMFDRATKLSRVKSGKRRVQDEDMAQQILTHEQAVARHEISAKKPSTNEESCYVHAERRKNIILNGFKLHQLFRKLSPKTTRPTLSAEKTS